ncbi:xanthine dehydrogenase family protein subunit M [Candidatus Acetothermia bacterium]|nr:xanthine dehydrogenase family protein subunit M [Candidatus Acetothermia bacterium]MBI3643006.1 xanthine dehydrogenase family protein subunit M [Candidatus Acetothermia bacterium]
MKNFEYVSAPNLASAITQLQGSNSKALAGGTDLLTEMKERIKTPDRLVNLKSIHEMQGVRDDKDKLWIGALTTLSEIESHRFIAERYPILAQAAYLTASHQLRNAGTLGGNLCQSVRCWYYRHPDLTCWLKGGETCYAQEGINRHHAILGNAPCIAVQPSDLAPALIALDAVVRLKGDEVDGDLSLDEFFVLPDEGLRQRTVLGKSDLVVGVSIPKPAASSRGIYLKSMEREDWSFALVSVAVQLNFAGSKVGTARIVLGGVAGKPWRAKSAEAVIQGKVLNDSLAEEAGAAAVAGASPFEHNGYKVVLAKNLVKRALLELNK